MSGFAPDSPGKPSVLVPGGSSSDRASLTRSPALRAASPIAAPWDLMAAPTLLDDCPLVLRKRADHPAPEHGDEHRRGDIVANRYRIV
jgi:hypothetical protein